MSWTFDENRPIFQQIVERITSDIVSGKYKPGDKLPSVREFALDAGVNPNTMQKALSELENMGLVETQRNSGRTVTLDKKLISQTRKKAAVVAASKYIEFANDIGISLEEAIDILREVGNL